MKLKDALSYNHETGLFRWKKAPNRRMYEGSIAGGVDQNGYYYIGFNHKRYSAARVAWHLYYGHWPAGIVRLKDGNPLNLRITNLKDAKIQDQISYSQAEVDKLLHTIAELRLEIQKLKKTS